LQAEILAGGFVEPGGWKDSLAKQLLTTATSYQRQITESLAKLRREGVTEKVGNAFLATYQLPDELAEFYETAALGVNGLVSVYELLFAKFDVAGLALDDEVNKQIAIFEKNKATINDNVEDINAEIAEKRKKKARGSEGAAIVFSPVLVQSVTPTNRSSAAAAFSAYFVAFVANATALYRAIYDMLLLRTDMFDIGTSKKFMDEIKRESDDLIETSRLIRQRAIAVPRIAEIFAQASTRAAEITTQILEALRGESGGRSSSSTSTEVVVAPQSSSSTTSGGERRKVPKKSKALMIGQEMIDEDELREVFSRSLALYLSERSEKQK